MVFTLIHLDQRHDEENEYNDNYAVAGYRKDLTNEYIVGHTLLPFSEEVC